MVRDSNKSVGSRRQIFSYRDRDAQVYYGQAMRFSHWINNGIDWSEILRSGVRCDDTGWDGLWFADHFMPSGGPVDGPIHEVWAALSGLAQATSKVRLGPLVCGNTYRNPAVLMKTAVTADHIADGRIVLGIGSGWQENEHLAYGIEFGTFSDRFEKLEEALQIMRGLRDSESFSLNGTHYTMAEAPLSPKPVGALPILIGGGGERKTLRMVAQYAEEWNVWSTPDIIAHKSAVLNQHCERIGRDPATVQRSSVALLFLCATDAEAEERRAKSIGRPSLIGTAAQLQEQMAAYVAAGVNEVIIPDFTLGTGNQKDETLDQFLEEVAAPFRNA